MVGLMNYQRFVLKLTFDLKKKYNFYPKAVLSFSHESSNLTRSCIHRRECHHPLVATLKSTTINQQKREIFDNIIIYHKVSKDRETYSDITNIYHA